MKPDNTRRLPFNASTFYRCSSLSVPMNISRMKQYCCETHIGGDTSRSTSVNTANSLLQENKGHIHNGIAVSGILACFKK